MSLWTSVEIEQATGGKALGNWSVDGIEIDSREIQNGDLFLALKAARDGHEFVAGAIAKGAGAAMVSHIPEGCENLPLIIVDDVDKALAAMGQARRHAVNAQTIAVTGSAGKTSTKEMLLTVLSSFGKTHASVRSFNNHLGVPITLARMPKDADFAVFEIGMNAPGEIAPLVAQVQPEIAIITNVAPVHLAGFDNEMGIAKEKAAIFSGLSENGTGLVFGDMEYTDYILSTTDKNIKTFGEKPASGFKLIKVSEFSERTESQIEINSHIFDMKIHASGRHHAMNGTAVMGAIAALGLDLPQALKAMECWVAPAGRGEHHNVTIDGKNIQVIDESYNANPLSMKATLASFIQTDAKRLIAILGEMGELGPKSPQFHKEIALSPAVEKIDQFITVGENMKYLRSELKEAQKLAHFDTTEGLLDFIKVNLEEGDAILLKASNYMGLGKTVDALVKLGQSDDIH